MAVNAHHLDARQNGGTLVGLHHAVMRYAKFAAFKTGGNIGVCFGVHVGVDPNTDRCLEAQAQGHLAQDL